VITEVIISVFNLRGVLAVQSAKKAAENLSDIGWIPPEESDFEATCTQGSMCTHSSAIPRTASSARSILPDSDWRSTYEFPERTISLQRSGAVIQNYTNVNITHSVSQVIKYIEKGREILLDISDEDHVEINSRFSRSSRAKDLSRKTKVINFIHSFFTTKTLQIFFQQLIPAFFNRVIRALRKFVLMISWHGRCVKVFSESEVVGGGTIDDIRRSNRVTLSVSEQHDVNEKIQQDLACVESEVLKIEEVLIAPGLEKLKQELGSRLTTVLEEQEFDEGSDDFGLQSVTSSLVENTKSWWRTEESVFSNIFEDLKDFVRRSHEDLGLIGLNPEVENLFKQGLLSRVSEFVIYAKYFGGSVTQALVFKNFVNLGVVFEGIDVKFGRRFGDDADIIVHRDDSKSSESRPSVQLQTWLTSRFGGNHIGEESQNDETLSSRWKSNSFYQARWNILNRELDGFELHGDSNTPIKMVEIGVDKGTLSEKLIRHFHGKVLKNYDEDAGGHNQTVQTVRPLQLYLVDPYAYADGIDTEPPLIRSSWRKLIGDDAESETPEARVGFVKRKLGRIFSEDEGSNLSYSKVQAHVSSKDDDEEEKMVGEQGRAKTMQVHYSPKRELDTTSLPLPKPNSPNPMDKPLLEYTFLVSPSVHAGNSTHFEDNSVDLVFIDGDHEYEKVLEDVETWYKKIKKPPFGHGILSGHDFFCTDGSMFAVLEFFGKKVNRTEGVDALDVAINIEGDDVWWVQF